MSSNHERTKNISIDMYIKRINGRRLKCCIDKKILGSNFLYAVIARILWSKPIRNITAEFKNIKFQEE